MFSDCLPIYTYFVFYYRYLRRRDVAQAQGEFILNIVLAISLTSYFSLQPTKQSCAPPYEWEDKDDSLWYDRARGVLHAAPYPAKVREHHLRREAEQVQLERLRRVSLFSFPYGQLV